MKKNILKKAGIFIAVVSLLMQGSITAFAFDGGGYEEETYVVERGYEERAVAIPNGDVYSTNAAAAITYAWGCYYQEGLITSYVKAATSAYKSDGTAVAIDSMYNYAKATRNDNSTISSSGTKYNVSSASSSVSFDTLSGIYKCNSTHIFKNTGYVDTTKSVTHYN